MGYKLVVDEQRDTVVIGVGKDGCDPQTFKVLSADNGIEGCLWARKPAERWATAIAQLPQLIEDAERAWAINPLNPEYKPGAMAKRVPVTSDLSPAAAATVTEAPTEELPLLEQSEEETPMTTETTPPEETPVGPEGPQDAPVAPEETPDAQEAPVAPQETPDYRLTDRRQVEDPEDAPPPGTWPGGYEAQAQPGDPEAQGSPLEAVGAFIARCGEPEAQRDPPETEAAPAPAAPAAGNGNGGSWRYYVRDGAEAGFDTVHGALQALGVTQEEIDNHKYWHRHDRLPKVHADAIRKERVGSG